MGISSPKMDASGKNVGQVPLDSFLPWMPEQTYLSDGSSFPPDALAFAPSTTNLYLPQATELSSYLSNSSFSQWPSLASPAPFTADSSPMELPMEYLAADTFLYPGMWNAPETESDSGDQEQDELYPPLHGHFSPATDRPSPPVWPWSHTPSPSASPALPKSIPEPVIPQRSKPTPKLRTAARKARKTITKSPTTPSSDSTSDATLTLEERRARRNHNIVEKQYRNRLNAQFERLLAVLPPEHQKTPDDNGTQASEDGRDTASDRRLSKAEVLEVATRRIKALELERRRLYRERKALLQNIEGLTRQQEGGIHS